MLTTFVMATFFSIQIDLMGSENYRAREAAYRALSEAKDLAVPTFMANLNHRNPEISRRCALLMKEYKVSVLATLKPTKYDFFPWITCVEWIPQRSSEIETDIIDKYSIVRTFVSNYRPEFREATMEMVFEMHMAGLPRWRIVAVLDDMIAVEKRRMERDNLPFPLMPKAAWTPPKQLDKAPK